MNAGTGDWGYTLASRVFGQSFATSLNVVKTSDPERHNRGSQINKQIYLYGMSETCGTRSRLQDRFNRLNYIIGSFHL